MRMRLTAIRRLALLSLFCVVCCPVSAAQLLGAYKVKSVFAEGTDTAGLFLVEDLPQCLYGLMYIDLSSNAGRAKLALLTSAKMGGWKITRIDFTQAANGKCTLDGVHVE